MQVLGQLLLITFKTSVKFVPQAMPEAMLTLRLVAAPEIAPLPEIDHAYELIPSGPWNWLVKRGQTNAGPVIEQTGSGETVKRTSLVSVQPLDWMTVSRKVAVAEKTCAVVDKESVASRIAVPFTTLQVVEAIG